MSDWTLQMVVKKLLVIQGVVSTLPLMVFLFFREEQLLAMAGGGALACLLTAYKWLAFRRQAVLKEKNFFRLIIRLEIMKLLLVALGCWLLTSLQLPPLGIAIGFSIGYLMYFFLLI